MDTSTWEITQYAELINRILHHGEMRSTRAGNAYSLFGETITINIEKEFPLLHGRKIYYKPVLGEFAAMLRGPNNVKDFQKYGCNYWNEWGDKQHREEGHLELDYGNAWINYNGVNQLETVIQSLKSNPTDRRMLISSWRPDRLASLSLPCCHLLYQWYVRGGTHLDMIWYQRSVDTMVGLPSDIVLCAAWNILLARQCGYEPGVIKLILGDTHIYENHIPSTLTYMRQLQRSHSTVKPYHVVAPEFTDIFNFEPEMIHVQKYYPMPAIKFKLNV